jgi:hypothetical protein
VGAIPDVQRGARGDHDYASADACCDCRRATELGRVGPHREHPRRRHLARPHGILTAWAVRTGQQANRAAAKAAEEAERANLEASKARTAVANERARTFELETLRDVLRVFDVRVRAGGGVYMTPSGTSGPMPDVPVPLGLREIITREGARIRLLPAEGLPTWNRLISLGPTERWEDVVGELGRSNTRDPYDALYQTEAVVVDRHGKRYCRRCGNGSTRVTLDHIPI